jgi:hypothetical protein
MANYLDVKLYIAGCCRQADDQRVTKQADESVFGAVPHASADLT